MKIVKQDGVIERFIEKHGDKYNYDLVEYKTMKTPVKIICPKHDIFEQKPVNHLKSGCPKCAGRGLTNDERIDLFREVHGDTYSYDKFVYKNAKTKSIITCKTHGDFLQIPDSHLRGAGCWDCGVEYRNDLQRSNKDEFVQKASVIHNDRYDYDLVEYLNNTTKVIIVCDLHGEFTQSPTHHLSGEGCPDCANIRRGDSQRSNTNEFSEKARIVHNGKYNYDLVDYINNRTKIDIICEKHGVFKQSPDTHLAGSGCPKCYNRGLSNDTRIKRLQQVHGDRYCYDDTIYTYEGKIDIICDKHGTFRQKYANHLSGNGCPKCYGFGLTEDEKIEQFREVHDDRYDYSDIGYVDVRTKIKIECFDHGFFYQTPNKHLSGSGCPKCNYTMGEDIISQYLEEKNIPFIPQQRFEECRGDSKPLSFDFYIPKYDILIEYDGIQHFEYRPDYFHKDGYHMFERQQRYDEIKNSYAKENEILLLRISYMENTLSVLSDYIDKFL